MADPQVTIVVSPRERFSFARESLESIYAHTQYPFRLIYVDGNSPPATQRYLSERSQDRGFQIIRTNHYLTPNQARNLGLSQVKTEYVVFCDNDVIVAPGWLQHLVQCAEETGATVVGPLMCQGEPVHETVHFAGGESHVWRDKTGKQRLREKMYKQGQQVNALRQQLKRTQTELAEFHCVLVRTEIFKQIGPLDEAMFNTKEHLDFCMTVAQAGGAVYFEPAAVVTYVPGPPLRWTDLHLYMLRWSDAWTLKSLHRLRDKWNVAEDGYFQNKYKKLGWRRKKTILAPLNRKLTFGSENYLLAKILSVSDRVLNRWLTLHHAWMQPKKSQKGEFTSASQSQVAVSSGSRAHNN